MKIEIKDGPNKSHKLLYAGGMYLGYMTTAVDGYWYWNAPMGSGTYSSYHLKLISDKLDEMNDEWEGIIKNELNNQTK